MELIEKIEKLADEARNSGSNNVAIILYTLIGSLHSNSDCELTKIVRDFAAQQINNIKAQKN